MSQKSIWPLLMVTLAIIINGCGGSGGSVGGSGQQSNNPTLMLREWSYNGEKWDLKTPEGETQYILNGVQFDITVSEATGEVPFESGNVKFYRKNDAGEFLEINPFELKEGAIPPEDAVLVCWPDKNAGSGMFFRGEKELPEVEFKVSADIRFNGRDFKLERLFKIAAPPAAPK